MERGESIYRRHELPIDVGVFLGGFAWDALTLTRIDRVLDNVLLALYVAALGVLLTLERRLEATADRSDREERWLPWVRLGAQFLFGGLLSAYVVFYFRSAASLYTYLFMLGLVGVMLWHEFRGHRSSARRLRLVMYWFVAFSFLLFFLPVVLRQVGSWQFYAAALGATALALPVQALGDRQPPGSTPRARREIGAWLGLAAGLRIGMWLSVVPPVPLSITELGIFHDVERTEDGDYVLSWEPSGGLSDLWRREDAPFQWHGDESVYCFSAIFAPSDMTLKVRHRWERLVDDTWRQTDLIDVTSSRPVRGGRQGGYRTYSRKARVVPGEWRVIVETASGMELGRHRFTILATKAPPRPLRSREAL